VSVLRDVLTGNEVLLTEGVISASGTLVAVITVVGEGGVREVRAGDRFQVGDASYSVEELKSSVATLTKSSPKLALPERRVFGAPTLRTPALEGIP
jgi:hypothetical protein